jgi:hypothetical protein
MGPEISCLLSIKLPMYLLFNYKDTVSPRADLFFINS